MMILGIEITEKELESLEFLSQKIGNSLTNFFEQYDIQKSFVFYYFILRLLLNHWVSAIESPNSVRDRCKYIRNICDSVEEDIKTEFINELKKGKSNGKTKRNK